MKIQTVSGRGIPLPGNEIDTDRIIPARYLKCITFDELGQYAFYDVRFNEDGSPQDHPLNDKRYVGGSILLVGRNFGCGSSREHAPQSILRFGIKAIVGISFAEIFADNCTAIGLPAVTAEKADLERLMKFVEENPACEIGIDLNKGELKFKDSKISITLSQQSKNSLTTGSWDSTEELLSAKDQIKEITNNLPYTKNFS